MRTLPGWWPVLVRTATVTAQGALNVDPSTRSGDFYLATTGDLDVATSGDFLMATDKRSIRSEANDCRGRALVRHARQVLDATNPSRRASHPPSGHYRVHAFLSRCGPVYGPERDENAGDQLTHFDEPAITGAASDRQAHRLVTADKVPSGP